MHFIPVIDLLGGQVVHARRGQRDRYAPLASPLCPVAEPGAAIAALHGLYPFATCYLADLDAIAGTGDNLGMIADLVRRWPGIECWVDAGPSWEALPPGVTPVLGSESLRDLEPLHHALAQYGEEQLILSLDFRGDCFLGPAPLLQQSSIWPQRVLAMNLLRVGGESGPDFALLRRLRRFHDGLLYAAGGIRHQQDLERLASAGIDGALLASALHSGAVTATDLASF